MSSCQRETFGDLHRPSYSSHTCPSMPRMKQIRISEDVSQASVILKVTQMAVTISLGKGSDCFISPFFTFLSPQHKATHLCVVASLTGTE